MMEAIVQHRYKFDLNHRYSRVKLRVKDQYELKNFDRYVMMCQWNFLLIQAKIQKRDLSFLNEHPKLLTLFV